jgi:hypothetical protein
VKHIVSLAKLDFATENLNSAPTKFVLGNYHTIPYIGCFLHCNKIKNEKKTCRYRINSHISRENLDKILSIRLIHLSQKISPQMSQNLFMYVSEPSIHKNQTLEFLNFGYFLPHFFSNSTYTQVYTVPYKSRNFGQNLSKIFSIRLIRGS